MKFHCQVFSALFICGLISRVASSKITSSNCGSLEFRCRNGECIASGLLCDGRPDCSDRSDETREECTRPEIVCPEFAFRCNYGACVDGDATCNGIDDCIDRSDELLPRCAGNSTISGAICTEGQFRCDDGQCIRDTEICDGTTDCKDGSDETTVSCSGIDCPAFTFRCNYGACIDDDLKCNRARNCVDGSDEDPNLCELLDKPVIDVREKRPSSSPREPGIPETSGRPGNSCRIPSQPENGRWLLHKSQCQSDQNCDLRNSSDVIVPGTHLIYSCNKGYKLTDSANVFCGLSGGWSSTPECVEINCKPLGTASTSATCAYEGDSRSCEEPVPPGTTAQVSCRLGYYTSTILSTRRDNVRCNARGQWQPEPIRCTPVCGRTRASNKPLIFNGKRANITEFPWHATLYKSEIPGGEKRFVCGATIIQSDLLITAAHCVYSESFRKLEDPNKYAVATGNIFRDYDHRFHDPNIVKKANVSKIYMDCNYVGLAGNYASDIAILRIDGKFEFSSLLMPACLDVSSYSDESFFYVGSYGRVAGFGRTEEGGWSQILQTLNVPYRTLDECKESSFDPDSQKYITIDKFCGGYTNGSSVCDGDSGGGIVFRKDGDWYLKGLVSVGILATYADGTTSCDSHAYALYTKISSHIAWIQNVILKLELYNEFPSCSDKFRNRETRK